ncbi:MAG TPA: hypothetical protein VFL31_03010 [Nitrospiraceae bacterium]|nr:hypothetical protein [Nitrospiraceae bacterium]
MLKVIVDSEADGRGLLGIDDGIHQGRYAGGRVSRLEPTVYRGRRSVGL